MNLIMELFIMDNGLLMDSEMAKVFNYGMMVLFMWAIGKMIKQMAKAV